MGVWLVLSVPAVFAQVGTQLTSGEVEDFFGTAIAMDDEFVYIGAPEDNTQGEGAGALYIFRDTNLGNWEQVAKLTAADGTDGDLFGSAVAVSGEYLLIGAPRSDDAGTDAGAVYLFVHTGSEWVQQVKLTAPQSAAGALFGSAVALQGDVALVTATLDAGMGAAYVFTWNGTDWAPGERLVGGDIKSGDRFGSTVALDGGHLLIGAPAESDNGSGAVYVFEGSGGTWTQRSKLMPDTNGIGDRFGSSVALEGAVAVIGAQRDDEFGTNAGTAYVYQKSGGHWVQEAKLNASDAGEGDEFGFSVGVSEDFILVGTVTGGTTYVFQRWNNLLWTERAKLGLPDEEELLVQRNGPVVVNRRRGGIGSTRFPGTGQVQIVSFEELASPELTAPTDEASRLETDLALRWNPYPNTESYRLQVALHPDFAAPVIDIDELDVQAYAVNGLQFGTTFYWRVLARTSIGLSIWSPIYRFSTQPGGSTRVVPVAPADGAMQQALEVDLVWQPVAGASTYTLEVSTRSNFSVADVVDVTDLTDTSYPLTGLDPLTTYYWRVLASNAGVNNWSSSRHFTTASGVPARVVLNRPEAGVPNQPTALFLEWEAIENAASYTVEMATDSEFNNTVRRAPGLTEPRHQVTQLDHGTTYYWRVQAVNAFGGAPWSEVWRFVTMRGGDAQVMLSSPADEATGIPLSPTLEWEAVNGAGTYQVQVSTQANFSSAVVDAAGIAATQYQASGLSPNTQYYWRVLASNAGTNNWSSSRRFTTASGLPVRVVLDRPASGATSVAVAPTLTWTTAAEATSYALQVSTSADFSELVVDAENISGTAYDVPTLAYGTLYHWRVQARNAFGIAPWSEARQFVTLAGGPTRVQPSTPADENVVQGINALLIWGRVDGAETYHVQVGTQRTLNEPLVDVLALADTAHAVTDLNPNTMYYWRVRASNAGPFNWSETWSFSTSEQPPAAPILIAPADSAADVETRPRFEWRSAPLAASYQLEVSTAPDFTASLFQVGLSDTVFQAVELTFATDYYWRVQAQNAGGTTWSTVRHFRTVTNVANEANPPEVFALAQNYPNPFRSTTTLTYTLPQPEHVRMIIYDVRGREIERLVDGPQQAGRHILSWQPRTLQSGIFFARMEAGGFSALRKMVVVQ